MENTDNIDNTKREPPSSFQPPAQGAAPDAPGNEEPAFRRQVSGALLRLRTYSPFFAALALFARIIPTDRLETAATDGRDLFINPRFFAKLNSAQQTGLLLHEILHAALQHVSRRRERDRLMWNIAADIIVNGAITNEDPDAQHYALPEGGVRDEKLEHLSVEEVFQIIQSNPKYKRLRNRLALRDLLDVSPLFDEAEGILAGVLGEAERAQLESHWRAALNQARAHAEHAGHGSVPAGLTRELGSLDPAQLDWRSYLWAFLVKTPTDFQGFDRRFIGQRLYLEALEGESVRVYVAVDTSGSVDGAQMTQFLSETQGILRAYPHIECLLFYADAACYGPYLLTAESALPTPKGGGGTDFRPFFRRVEQEEAARFNGTALCVYLTDGYGTFPNPAPTLPTLWALTAGGLAADQVPFGEVTRMLADPV